MKMVRLSVIHSSFSKNSVQSEKVSAKLGELFGNFETCLVEAPGQMKVFLHNLKMFVQNSKNFTSNLNFMIAETS